MYQDCNTELVAQFCATAWTTENGYEQTLNFSIEGHWFEFPVVELPTIFGLAPNDFHRTEITTERTITENKLAPLYFPGNEHNFGTTHGLLPEYTIFNNIFHNTLTPKRGDRTKIQDSTRNLLLAIVDDQAPPYISIFFSLEMMYMLNHGVQYVMYAPYIQRIIIYKNDMEFGYDGKHGQYQPHIVRGPAAPSRPPTTAAMGTSATAHDSPPAGHRGKKQSIIVKGLKTLIPMCRSNDALIRESHQQMSQRLFTLEEHERKMRTSMGFETPDPIAYPPILPPAVEDPWGWYNNKEGNEDYNDDKNEEESE
jgi:hypothetical protein